MRRKKHDDSKPGLRKRNSTAPGCEGWSWGVSGLGQTELAYSRLRQRESVGSWSGLIELGGFRLGRRELGGSRSGPEEFVN